MAKTPTLKTNRFYIAFSLALWLFLCQTPLYGQGVLLDSTDYNTLPFDYGGEKGSEKLPPSKSLKDYCPRPIDQGKTMFCLPFACIYAAFTIEKHRKTQPIMDSTYSATYILHQMKKNIDVYKGLNIENLRNYLKGYGFCRTKNYPNDVIRINIAPSLEAEQEAKILRDRYKNDTLCPLYLKNDSYRLIKPKLKDIFKNRLYEGQPIIFAAKVDSDFQKPTNEFWTPNDQQPYMHTMVIIGYNDADSAFEIMNSYGTNWGNQGFIKLKYTYLEQIIAYAYVLNRTGSKGEGDELDTLSNQIDSTVQDPTAKIELKQQVNDGSNTFFETEPVQYDTLKKMYETTRACYVNSSFKLVASDSTKGKEVYIFSLDSANIIHKHTFFDTIQVKYRGNDHIFILIAHQPIGDFEQRLEKFEASKETIQIRFKAAFGNILMPEEDVTYMEMSDDMTVKSRRFPALNRGVVPIILSIKIK
jgi:Papain family cysteine protease